MSNGIYRGIQYVIVARRLWRREDRRVRLHIHRREMPRQSLGARPSRYGGVGGDDWCRCCDDYSSSHRLSSPLSLLLLRREGVAAFVMVAEWLRRGRRGGLADFFAYLCLYRRERYLIGGMLLLCKSTFLQRRKSTPSSLAI